MTAARGAGWSSEGEVVRLRIEGPLTANRFLPGHRLRIALSGAFYPLFSVNPQTGAQEFESDSTRAGEIRVHSGGSMVILPRVPTESQLNCAGPYDAS